jgi:AbrB family looped-hinge helix DNA binding protein
MEVRMSLITVSSKGQLVIPKNVRKEMHIKSKQKLLFKVVKDHAEIIPMPEYPVEAFCGVFEEGSSLVEMLLRERKEELRHEEKNTARFLRTARISKKRG